MSQLAIELEQSETNVTGAEEMLLSPSTASTFNRANDYNEQDNENAIIKSGTENSTRFTEIFDSSETQDSSYIIPIKIILPAPHIHAVPGNGTFEQFNYILLLTNDSSYHGHLDNGAPDILYPMNVSPIDYKPPTNEIDVEETDIGNNSNGSGSGAGPISDLINTTNVIVNLVDSDGYQYQRTKKYRILDKNGDLAIEYEEIAAFRPKDETNVATTTVSSVGRQQNEAESNMASEQYDDHYSKILQWISYKL